MEMTINFLLQTMRVLHVGNYDEEELSMVYNFITSVTDDVLNDYKDTCTILSYENDLELYMEILDICIVIFEDREEYEKCQKLKHKKEEVIKIIENKTI
jgi:hypothetical protein